ncbi:hypothetical protein [Enterovibrio norvegicus]|uniref:hypothetical protein n=1 Tax=Enterovibrio norvegicus TaxID=188144 RepID=UPI00352C0006
MRSDEIVEVSDENRQLRLLNLSALRLIIDLRTAANSTPTVVQGLLMLNNDEMEKFKELDLVKLVEIMHDSSSDNPAVDKIVFPFVFPHVKAGTRVQDGFRAWVDAVNNGAIFTEFNHIVSQARMARVESQRLRGTNG